MATYTYRMTDDMYEDFSTDERYRKETRENLARMADEAGCDIVRITVNDSGVWSCPELFKVEEFPASEYLPCDEFGHRGLCKCDED